MVYFKNNTFTGFYRVQKEYHVYCIIFYLSMPNYIFQFPATGAGSFLRYLERAPKELFFNEKPRSEDVQFKTLPKKSKIPR
jgi:hypothetical protein